MLMNVVLFLTAALGLANSLKVPLNDHVSHYEPLEADFSDFVVHYNSRRRSEPDFKGSVEINAFGRKLNLLLTRVGLTHPQPASIHDKNGLRIIDTSELPIFEGHIEGLSNSYVKGHIIDGIFEASIHCGDDNEMIFIEHANKFFNYNRPFNHIMYKGEDIEFNVTAPNGEKRKLCMGDVSDTMKSLISGNPHASSEGKKPSEKRKRRGVSRSENTCLIHLVSDQTFFAQQGFNEMRTISEMERLLVAANSIYSTTNFYEKHPINIASDGFHIYSTSDSTNPVADTSKNVDEVLIDFGIPDWSKHCLAHLFTHRDYNGGVLGLAWIAQPGLNAGGICQDRIRTSGGERSLNTGLSSSLNFGNSVPFGILYVTLAHEVGHNFGSDHDPRQCSGQNGGNFVMFAQAVDGSQPNNNKFSSCSIEKMTNVMDNVNCFEAYPNAVCGNGKRENDEECDCGTSCTPESCCTSDCKLPEGADCSPLSSECCTRTCAFSNSITQCKAEEDCSSSAFCTGIGGDCPDASPKPNLEVCGEGAYLCQAGTCSRNSVCVLYSAQVCVIDGKECEVSCSFPDNNGCETIAMYNERSNSNLSADFYPSGTPCGGDKGFCNNDKVCQGVDTDSLDSLEDFFSAENIHNMANFIRENWYWFLGGGLAGIFMIMVLGCITNRQERMNAASKREKSKNHQQQLDLHCPSMTPAATGGSTSNNSSGAQSRATRTSRAV